MGHWLQMSTEKHGEFGKHQIVKCGLEGVSSFGKVCGVAGIVEAR